MLLTSNLFNNIYYFNTNLYFIYESKSRKSNNNYSIFIYSILYLTRFITNSNKATKL